MTDAMLLGQSPVGPDAVWRTWTFDPVVVAGLVGAALAYARGAARLRRRGARGPSARRAASFWGGLSALGIALVSPLDAAAGALFSFHMVQHLLLVVVAAPLLVAARPVRTLVAGLPAASRSVAVRQGSAMARSGSARALRRPAVAWTVATLVLWAWHTPTLYTAGVENPPIHALEHASFLVTSMVVWSVALRRSRATAGALGRALFLSAWALQSALLGALLLFGSTPLFPVHGEGPASWGLTPLQDQQLAGALMWIPPSAVSLAVAAGILVGSFRAMDDRARRPAERAVA